MTEFEEKQIALLERIARDQKTTRELIGKFVYAMVEEAEAEIPEKMRRFANYMHDIHDIVNIYEERGNPVPQYILHDLERCHDRYRQLLKELHLEGNTFAKVRAEMAPDPENRYDHTRLLFKPKEETK